MHRTSLERAVVETRGPKGVALALQPKATPSLEADTTQVCILGSRFEGEVAKSLGTKGVELALKPIAPPSPEASSSAEVRGRVAATAPSVPGKPTMAAAVAWDRREPTGAKVPKKKRELTGLLFALARVLCVSSRFSGPVPF